MLKPRNRLSVLAKTFLFWSVGFSLMVALAPAADDELPDYRVRDPFWPVGTPPPQSSSEQPIAANTNTSTPTAVAPAATKWPELKMKGIVSGPKGFMVIIEGVGMA
jgi:hypothetical protein